MRRKTNDKDLAKRARNLVRKWQQLVETSNRLNGERIAESRGAGSAAYLPPHLQGSSGSQPSSPASQPHTPSSIKSHSPSLPSRSRPDTPTARPHTPSAAGNQHSPKLSVLGRPVTPGLQDSQCKPASPALGGSQTSPGLPTPGRVHVTSTPLPGRSSSLNHHLTTPSTHDAVAKFDAANKKRRRDDDAHTDPVKRVLVDYDTDKPLTGSHHLPNGVTPSQSAPAHISQLGSNGNCDSPNLSPDADSSLSHFKQDRFPSKRNVSLVLKTDERSRSSSILNKTPKVETTAQLLQKLDLKLPSSDTVSKIANNQIEKEYDMDDISIVPAGAKPRPRRKPATSVIPPSSCDSSLEQTKTEMVQKFLQTSVTPSSSELDMMGAFKFDPPSRPDSPASFVDVTGVSDPSLNTSGQSAAIENHSQATADKTGSVMFFIGDEEGSRAEALGRQELDPWSALPPIRMADLVWPSQELEERTPVEVDDSSLDRLQNDHWTGVNGRYDYLDQWKDWTQTYSMPTYNGDLLHILPYVNTDD